MNACKKKKTDRRHAPHTPRHAPSAVVSSRVPS